VCPEPKTSFSVTPPLKYLYGSLEVEAEPGVHLAKRRIAANIAKLPDLQSKPKDK
jgi:hypothetical protein